MKWLSMMFGKPRNAYEAFEEWKEKHESARARMAWEYETQTGTNWCGKSQEMAMGWAILSFVFAAGVAVGIALGDPWGMVRDVARLCVYIVVAIIAYSLGMDRGYEKGRRNTPTTDLDRDYRTNPVKMVAKALLETWWDGKWVMLAGLVIIVLVGVYGVPIFLR